MSHVSASPLDDSTPTPVEPPSQVERDRQMINDARERGIGPLFWTFTKLSGPGWLQSAITLGGGSLGGSLYLGVLAGFGLMWLQPLAMILGVIMLSAIGYVTLSSGQRPFAAINRHVNPVLGWSWLIATMMANMVWCMPQFALGTAAIRQNLMPEQLGSPAIVAAAEKQGIDLESEAGREFQQQQDQTQSIICVIALLFIGGTIVWFYDSGSWGIKLFELILKAMVGMVVICFFGVVIKMSLSSQGLDWARILAGFIPDFSLLHEPSPAFAETLAQTGAYADYWKNLIVSDQQKVMITAAATAVGINMTFLLPYSMLARGWDRDFRGLAVFDLATGLFVPFMLATSCVVIAAATQFHARPSPGFVDEREVASPKLAANYHSLLDGRIKQELGEGAFADLTEEELASARANLPLGDRTMAAMIVKRDASNLADSLQELVGPGTAQTVFGLGVLGMAVSTIIILMLINGFAVCEACGVPDRGMLRRFGALLAGLAGASAPFVWKGDAQFWLTVPTSMFGMILLPIAYVTFFFLMNSRSLMGENMPRGGKRVLWNVLMLIAVSIAAFGSFWSIRTSDYPTIGYAAIGGLFLLAVIVHFVRKPVDA